MTEHHLTGLRPTPLATYLAGLGLVRVIGEQADPAVTARWTADGLVLDTTVTDLAGWLVEDYIPTPVLSPWNEGSGFGAKDKTPKTTLAALLALPGPRLNGYRAAAAVASKVGRHYREQALSKEQAVREFRNRCPDAALPWIDATVVLTDGDLGFPPLLGTGGNDGRLDFSTNLHQRLIDVLAAPARTRSLRQATDLLTGVQVEAMQPAAVGQFDPVAAGGQGSSPFGTAESLVNPWTFVLMIEGALLFASGVTRRHAHAATRTAIPFTVASTPDGADSGAAAEVTRGEVWTPLWSRPFRLAEISQLFTEARVAWHGTAARRAVDFYQAVVTHGVARGVDAFIRYGLHQRNGLAFVAVPLDRVEVYPRPAVRLAATVEGWVTRIPRSASGTVRAAVRRFDAAQMAFAKTGTGEALVDMLAALTGAELAVGRSGRLRDDVGVRLAPRAVGFLTAFAERESPELRVAAGLASCAERAVDRRPGRSMRDLLLPIDPAPRGGRATWRDAPVVPGYGVRPLRDVLTDVLAWRCRTAAEPGGHRGVPTFRNGVAVPAADLHAWAAGELHDSDVERYFAALLALDWTSSTNHHWTAPAPPAVPVPTLALLQKLARGAERDGGEPALALDPGWVVLLRAQQVERVHDAAARRLRQAGWHPSPAPPRPPGAGGHDQLDGRALAAATVPRSIGIDTMLRRVARTTASTIEDTPTGEDAP